ncbi:AAA family ATPase [Streptomyces sp. NBC_00103]|uniref:AAA family ATPase n=1 Tax=Streptomyces sp. NBC_00103 TaxID=2975653 RepID=UPI00224E2E24|nr:AAA family ATPase [Streptomyces sp. NBC_00103]MCX5372950.1 ATP-binding protein [Streptomyces sp. NBC_00103]
MISGALQEADISIVRVDERSFPGERWFVVWVDEESLVTAQSLAGSIEQALNDVSEAANQSLVVTFRPHRAEESRAGEVRDKGPLSGPKMDQLIQLLEARSRTSDALPSLKYMEDPRASLAAVGASRHHLVYGRRGVGKTALLLEAKRSAERDGHVTAWINAHTLRRLDVASAFLGIAEVALNSLIQHAGSSQGDSYVRLKESNVRLAHLRTEGPASDSILGEMVAELNRSLRSVLREGLVRLYLYIDDFYLFPQAAQPHLLDCVAGMLRDCDGWIKVASIERLTRPFEPSSRIGIEVPHDASKIDLDVTLEDPGSTQRFLESVLANYTTTAGLAKPSSIAQNAALGRLVLASGGVPRDYLNLFASSIVAARSRPKAREIGREDVADAAGRAARSKKRDLEQDVSSDSAVSLTAALDTLAEEVRGAGYTYFRVDVAQKSHQFYELLGQLVDLRFAHLIQSTLSDQHRPGVKYEVYILDLSEYADVRLKRGLAILDLKDGKWNFRVSGTAGTQKQLPGTLLRDELRRAPVVDLERLAEKAAERVATS